MIVSDQLDFCWHLSHSIQYHSDLSVQWSKPTSDKAKELRAVDQAIRSSIGHAGNDAYMHKLNIFLASFVTRQKNRHTLFLSSPLPSERFCTQHVQAGAAIPWQMSRSSVWALSNCRRWASSEPLGDLIRPSTPFITD